MPANKGELHHRAKLTGVQVMYLRRRYRSGGVSFETLAEEIENVVDAKAVRRAVRGSSWSHLPGEVKYEAGVRDTG